MSVLGRAAADLVLGVRCAGCESPGQVLCGACRAAIAGAPAIRAPTPVPAAFAGPPRVLAFSLGSYAGRVVDVLHAYKEEPRTALAVPLGDALGYAVACALDTLTAGAPPVRLVPVPSRRSAVRARGFDAGAALARRAAQALRRRGIPARVDAVLRVGSHVRDQAGLDAAERTANLDGAYRVRGRAGRGLVVLTDDVLTTGASAAEAIRALAAAGSRPAAIVTLAATQRRRRDRGGVLRTRLEKSSGPA